MRIIDRSLSFVFPFLVLPRLNEMSSIKLSHSISMRLPRSVLWRAHLWPFFPRSSLKLLQLAKWNGIGIRTWHILEIAFLDQSMQVEYRVVHLVWWLDCSCSTFRFCLGWWEIGKSGWASGQDIGTSQIVVSPTQLSDQMDHPVHMDGFAFMPSMLRV